MLHACMDHDIRAEPHFWVFFFSNKCDNSPHEYFFFFNINICQFTNLTENFVKGAIVSI